MTPPGWASAACGASRSSTSPATARWSGRVLSTSVMVRASQGAVAGQHAGDIVRRRRFCAPAGSARSGSLTPAGPGASSSSPAAVVSGVPGPNTAAAPASNSTGRSRSGDYSAHDDHDVGPAESGQFGDQLRHVGEVTGGQRGHPHDVHVVLHGLAGHLGGRLEQGPDVHVEAQVGVAAGHDLLAPIVPSWPILATRMRGRRPTRAASCSIRRRTAVTASIGAGGLAVHTGDRTDFGGVAAHAALEGVADLAHGGPGPGGPDGQVEQVAVPGRRRRRW